MKGALPEVVLPVLGCQVQGRLLDGLHVVSLAGLHNYLLVFEGFLGLVQLDDDFIISLEGEGASNPGLLDSG